MPPGSSPKGANGAIAAEKASVLYQEELLDLGDALWGDPNAPAPRRVLTRTSITPAAEPRPNAIVDNHDRHYPFKQDVCTHAPG